MKYGTVELQLVKTELFSHDPVYDESGTDLLYIRHRLAVLCVYNPQATAYTPTNAQGDTGPFPATGILPAVTDTALHQYLMTPRRSLLYQNGTDTLIQSPAINRSVDAKGGPFPTDCVVVEISGSKTFSVRWEVETYVSDCIAAPGGSQSPIVSSRWKRSQSVDSQRRTVITTTGLTYFRMDLLDAQNAIGHADYWRNQSIPGCPTGFRRDRLVADFNARGDILMWQVTDVQQMYSLGDENDPRRYDVETFDAVYSQVSTPGGEKGMNTGMVVAALDVHVVGAVEALRANLLVFAVKLALERLAITPGLIDPAKNATLRQIAVRETLTDRVVDLRAEVLLPPKQGMKGGLHLRTDYLGVDVIQMLANDGKSPQMADNNTRGKTWNGAIFTQALKDACAPVTLPGLAGQAGVLSANNEVAGQAMVLRAAVHDDLAAALTNYSEEQTSGGAYTEYHIDINYHRHGGRLGCPVAGPNGTPPEVLQLHAPYTTIVVDFEAERLFARCTLPDPYSVPLTWQLLDDWVQPSGPEPGPDGLTPINRASGRYEYVYVGKDAIGAGSILPQGAVPWSTYQYQDNMIQPEDFAPGIIGTFGGSHRQVGPQT